MKQKLYNLKMQILKDLSIKDDLKKDLAEQIFQIEQEIAINYTRCCYKLKEKEALSFQEYKRLNYTHLTNVYACKYTNQILSYEQTLEEYNKYLDSF